MNVRKYFPTFTIWKESTLKRRKCIGWQCFPLTQVFISEEDRWLISLSPNWLRWFFSSFLRFLLVFSELSFPMHICTSYNKFLTAVLNRLLLMNESEIKSNNSISFLLLSIINPHSVVSFSFTKLKSWFILNARISGNQITHCKNEYLTLEYQMGTLLTRYTHLDRSKRQKFLKDFFLN